MTMISFAHDDKRFNFRVAGVIISRGRVLLHRAENESFWALPGGRAELGETAAAGVVRELREEINVETVAERILWLVEGFFRYDNKHWHEIGLYFLLHLPADSPLHGFDEPFFGVEASSSASPIKLTYQWFDLSTLETMALFPIFLRTGLRALPQTIEHVVSDEEV